MTTTATTSPRLTPAQVQHFRTEGYLIPGQPVLPAPRFDALKNCFEGILADLPATVRPESMDVPHFMHPRLFEWAFAAEVLDLVAPILGPDLALFSTHFICKPRGNGKRVPWHEDSAYWRGQIDPMEVCTVWLALDPSRRENGCMKVLPRTHNTGRAGFSDYAPVDGAKNVFTTEVIPEHRNGNEVFVELEPNHCSLHDARIIHGSEPNTSSLRRCGWTLRFCSSAVKFNNEAFHGMHQVYLARGRDRGGNVYADPARAYPEVLQKRGFSSRYKNSH